MIVLSGFVTACLFASSPTRRSLALLEVALVKATTDGVVLAPSAFAITTGSPPSITATHEFVVPKSIPITFDIIYSSSNSFSFLYHLIGNLNHTVAYDPVA